jgi:hypothetical protein
MILFFDDKRMIAFAPQRNNQNRVMKNIFDEMHRLLDMKQDRYRLC